MGIRDLPLSERLQLDPELTLEKAKMVRQTEAVKEQSQQLRGEGIKRDPIVLNEVRRAPPRKQGAARGLTKGSQRTGKLQSPAQTQCKRCGRERHPLEKCPAKNAACHKCGKEGHFSSQCFSKLPQPPPAFTREVSLDSAFLGAVTSNPHAAWTVKLLVGTKEVEFKLDTGAELTVISEATHKAVGSPPLEKSTKALFGPTRQSLQVLGQYTAPLKHQDQHSLQTVYVVRDLKTNLLGLPAISALELLQRINSLQTDVDFRTQFTILG